MPKEFITRSADETISWGRELAAGLKPPLLILLSGDLGTGKTTLTKGIVGALGAAREDDVTSPTFTLLHAYGESQPVFHGDLYRIENGVLDGLGLEEIFDDPNAAVIVEWAERLGKFETPGATRVFLSYVDDHSRKIDIC